MRINPVNTFYNNENVPHSSKKVTITEHSQIRNAIDKGTITVEGVTLELSDEVRNAIKSAEEQRFKDNEKITMMNALIHNANVARQQEDVTKEVVLTEVKAMEIARRIAKGGKVPMQDEKLLMEYNKELYMMSKQAALLAKEHEEYDSLVDEDSNKDHKEYDVDEGKIDARYQIEVDVAISEDIAVESVSTVAVNI